MQTTKKTTITKTRPKPKRRIKNRKKRKVTKVTRKILRNRMPVASTNNFVKKFNITSRDGNSITVKGRDLVYSIPKIISNNQTDVMTIIPCNPCYWTGTRIAALGAGYQNYRPIKFKVTYVPQCAVTQQGNVIAGSMWNTVPSDANLQQSLRTSPGGMMTQCYKPKTTTVRMKSNLQYNLYRCGGKFDQESNPFIYLAISVACTNSDNQIIIPGYFYVDYTYIFKNPIGSTFGYYNSGMTTISEQTKDFENSALITCYSDTNSRINIGTLIQIDRKVDTNDKLYTYNDDQVKIDEKKPVWFFCCSTIQAVTLKSANRYKSDIQLDYIDEVFYQENPETQFDILTTKTYFIFKDSNDPDYYATTRMLIYNTGVQKRMKITEFPAFEDQPFDYDTVLDGPGVFALFTQLRYHPRVWTYLAGEAQTLLMVEIPEEIEGLFKFVQGNRVKKQLKNKEKQPNILRFIKESGNNQELQEDDIDEEIKDDEEIKEDEKSN